MSNRLVARQSAFLAAFAECGQVGQASAAAGIERHLANTWRYKDKEFGKRFEVAERNAIRVLEDKAYELAMAGDTKMIMFILERRLRNKYGRSTHIDLEMLSNDELKLLASFPAND